MTDSSDATPESTAPKVRSWKLAHKIVVVVTVAVFAFLGTFASSIIAPGRTQIQEDLGVSRTVSVLTFSFFNLGLAWGCTIGSPLSENFGRRMVYLGAMPGLLIFVMVTGFSGFGDSLAGILICRLLGGLCDSPGITLASATISDLFEPGDARGVALYCYYSMPRLGSVLGPLIGFLIVDVKSWEWTQWVLLFIAVPIVLPGLILLRETKQDVLDATAAHGETFKDRMEPSRMKSQIVALPGAIATFLRKSFLRPLEMLFTELIVGLVCLYAGFNFGLIYALVVVFPDVFGSTYNFGLADQGLSFLGLIVGCLVGPALLIIDEEIVKRKKRRRGAVSEPEKVPLEGKPPPEMRLRGAMYGAPMLPAGLIWFAWTAQPGISFLSPVFASVLITAGALLIYVSTSAYVVEVYDPRYSASANGASSIARYTMAAAIPLFILQIYDGLGTGWATSLLALCAFLMMPIPFCFFKWGPQLRSRCKFQTEQ